MNENRNRTYTGAAWGLILILLGVLMALPGDQDGIFFLGVGVILLGLNGLRRRLQIPIHLFSTLLGGLALVAGAYSLLRPALALPAVQVGFLPLMLMVIGLYVLIPGPRRTEN